MTALTATFDPTATLRCPKCPGEMTRYERSGVLVDQCLDCRGIYLDRGELERLIDVEGSRPDRSGTWVSERPASRDQDTGYRAEWRADDDDDRRPRSWTAPRRPERKRSLFGELFEGFGD